ncbi:MFS transporter [Cohnella cholangitidis]|uniref:MFS transporter n=1 Tax=Cohnella cholangitidis TaxID=2598458 RepID=A0A7G5C7J3_9BACL|nr:MFS transporter [Cohnella cholangitidis]QMV45177.1 MFS transporter [Cohnella cholangitidis]
MEWFQENADASLSRPVMLLIAVACGMAVANIYYAQPLLDAIAGDYGIGQARMGLIVTITQICYALGLIFLVPLGDLLNRRKLVAGMMFISVLGLIMVGMAPNLPVLLTGLAVVGLFTVVVQVLVVYAGSLAAASDRGRAVGMATSGVVVGLLLARTFAGMMSDLAGWRSVYWVSAGLTLLMVGVLLRLLPNEDKSKSPISYPRLLSSVFVLFVQEPILRIRAVLGMLIFTAFSILWTSLVLTLSAPPWLLSHSAIGSFGLAGAAGAIAAASAGRLADRGLGQRTTGLALVVLAGSWLPIGFTEQSLGALIVGVIALDLAVQAVHVTNQSLILRVRPEARSRLVAGYMVFYSLGSAAGSIASTAVYSSFGWIGVCLLGAAVSAFALLFWALSLTITRA